MPGGYAEAVRAAAGLLALSARADGESFAASVPEPSCVGPPGRQFLFGGVALAAVVEAMERRAGQPATFAAVQFLTQVRPGDRLRFDAALRSGEHTSELQSLMRISYAVFCLKKTKPTYTLQTNTNKHSRS